MTTSPHRSAYLPPADQRSQTHPDRVDAVLSRQARRTPEKTALTFGDREFTYRELDDAVSRAAGILGELALAPGSRIAAFGKNSDAYLIAFLACSRAGLVHVPVNFALTGSELGYLLTDSGASAVLFDPALAPTLLATLTDLGSLPTIALRDAEGSLIERSTSGEVPQIVTPASDLVQLLYTSGTTSRPKGAMMTHGALVHEYLSSIHGLDFRADDEPLQAMPLYHSAGMHVFTMPYLMIGATNHLLEVPEIGAVLRTIEERSIGSLFLAPTVWVPLSQHPDFATRDLHSLAKAYYGASIMPGPVLDRLRGALPELLFYNCFGQSEIGPLATILRPEEHDERPDSCGRPVLFVELRVIDSAGEQVPPGGTGEVVYRSPQLCEGYWNKPEETAEAFAGGWFHSGDLVRIDEGGFITVVDRIKDVINTGGVLVASREVEDALYTHPAVAEVAVIGTPDEKWIEAVTAFVVLKPDATVSAEELRTHSRATLAPFKVPKSVHFVEELPRNQSGKLLKRELRTRAD
ncbi:fatty acyl-CoA synthetase [Nakamurella sp. A5-74]|uniref:fatty acyl-CoA synthetase n=1 Tax=Nakamurella sp. A5-74 TaxID=3158264 RepID=UPI00336BFDFE